PVLGFAHYWHSAAQGTFRVDEVCGVEGGAAALALVAVGILVAALGAGAYNVAVGQELLRLLVVVLLRGLLYKLAIFVELFKEARSGVGMRLGRGAAVDIERDVEILEGVLDDRVVLVYC